MLFFRDSSLLVELDRQGRTSECYIEIFLKVLLYLLIGLHIDQLAC